MSLFSDGTAVAFLVSIALPLSEEAQTAAPALERLFLEVRPHMRQNVRQPRCLELPADQTLQELLLATRSLAGVVCLRIEPLEVAEVVGLLMLGKRVRARVQLLRLLSLIYFLLSLCLLQSSSLGISNEACWHRAAKKVPFWRSLIEQALNLRSNKRLTVRFCLCLDCQRKTRALQTSF